ncbi:ABC transporter ATP-binding protein [Sphaerobacter sp.]|uniref:ABC transporter ATP-binding protein n=1 Tax=Sphaerobacter sp. TaxID=2099654 RepID=UPI001D401F9F|nr:ABC transporter ATP-binding protein [Sphaerobacter sp.]MBX5444125.1 ABC transporter ATP-binding protein [Sphaerobacter sp.]
MLLEVRHIAASYDGVPALHDVSFTVDEGEVVTIIGSNGAGKTTTIRTISGQLRPDRGEILFRGTRIDGLPAHRIAEMGIAHVPEGRRLFNRLTVLQNLLVGSFTRRARAEEDAMLERVFTLFPRLKERANQRAGTLSGGEQQMLAIGRGLMLQPVILMLDEPSLGLAPMLVDEIFNTIRQIAREGMTILLVEQNVRESLELSDRAYVLQTGTTVAEGTGAELLESEMVRRAYLGL